jgi:nucleotide-binding universal stress UspA family protein
MLELKVLLCPVDFSEFSIRAYEHALSLAEHYRSKLMVLHVVEPFRHSYLGFAASASLYDQACHSLLEAGTEQLQSFVVDHTRRNVQPDLVVSIGLAADSILALAETHQADGIVMGTHGRRGYDRLMLGSVADRVMRTAPCPVLVVCKSQREAETAMDQAGAAHRLTRIVFCTDFSKGSERALRYALSARDEYDAELTLLHVLEEGSSADKREASMAGATRQLQEMIPAGVRTSPRFKTVVLAGKPYERIIEFAKEIQADIVAMGVRGRGALDVAVFGSTTYRVIQLGPCPVLVVHR